MLTRRLAFLSVMLLAGCAWLAAPMAALAQGASTQLEQPASAAPLSDVIVGQGWRLNVPDGWRRANAEEMAFVRERMQRDGATQLELVTVLLRADGDGERYVLIAEMPAPPPRMAREMAAQALAGSGGPGTSTILDPTGSSAAMRGDLTLSDGTAWHIRGTMHIGTSTSVLVRGEGPTSERDALEREAPSLVSAFSFAPGMAYTFGGEGGAAPVFSILGFLVIAVGVVTVFGIGMVILVFVLVKRGSAKKGGA